MDTKVGIVGSRHYTNYEFVKSTINDLNLNISLFVFGGASGVDTLSKLYAKGYSIPCKVYAANWKTYGKASGPIPNTSIVNDIDVLIAFPDPVS